MEHVKIPGLECYSITEDGQVFSHIKDKWLKPTQNNCGYFQYCLYNEIVGKSKWYKTHRLVAYTYNGPPPTPKHEAAHMDNNKGNNHYTNIKWKTHSENILQAYREHGRKCYWSGKNKPSPGLATRMLMANAKYKRIRATMNEGSIEFNSVQDTCKYFKWYRKKFNRIMDKGGVFYNNGIEIELSYID